MEVGLANFLTVRARGYAILFSRLGNPVLQQATMLCRYKRDVARGFIQEFGRRVGEPG